MTSPSPNPPVASHARLTIAVDKPGPRVSPVMFGLFFEDINYGADGGLYAELVQNRSFEHREHLFSWTEINRGGDGRMTIETSEPLNEKNRHYLRLDVRSAGEGYGAANIGFDGIPVKQGSSYRFSIHARSDANVPLRIALEDEQGNVLGDCAIEGLGADWRKFTCTIQSTATVEKARLVVLATAPGRVDLDMVSLFPADTWKGRENGLRADLVQLLADMRPRFLRFPGGCIVEGKDLANAYMWKETIGDVAERPQNWSRWMNAIPELPAPHYYQTYGLGYFEYFQLCEDIGAEPVPVVNCGMSCQYQDAEFVPLDQLGPWVQDALDLIEFANGPADTTWGAKRAQMGHPEPFNLKYLGVGNEQWGEAYFERYPIFYNALKAKHPEIILITTAGPAVDTAGHDKAGYEKWKFAWEKFNAGTPAEIVDEHYYCPPQWFLDQSTRYDRYARNGPKIFAGEYAAHDNDRRNNLRSALSEAAFITGLLRNADIVAMASYAPLFAREGFIQWKPDLIWLDATRVYGTPSYHVQAMFGRNCPAVVLPVEIQQPGQGEVTSLYAIAGCNAEQGELILFVVNVSGEAAQVELNFPGVEKMGSNGRAITLTSTSPDDENSFEQPDRVAPREEEITIAPEGLHTFPANSFTVLRMPAGA